MPAPPGATTVAGTGVPRLRRRRWGARSGARLDDPSGMVESASGDLFIADTGNCRVREVAAEAGTAFGRRVHAGEILTVAGGPCGTTAADPAPECGGRRRHRRPLHRLRPGQPRRGAAGGHGYVVGEVGGRREAHRVGREWGRRISGRRWPGTAQPARRPHRRGRRLVSGTCSSPTRELSAPHGGRLERYPVRDDRRPRGHLHGGRYRDLRIPGRGARRWPPSSGTRVR